MAIATLISGKELRRPRPLDDQGEAANRSWHEYLKRNVDASATLVGMRQWIDLFHGLAPRIFVSKCIDGRVHGSDAKGYPPSTVTFSRTEGNNVALTAENHYFWNRLNSVVLDARRHTPGAPALFIALGHYARIGHGCAAHHEDDAAALAAVAAQAAAIRKQASPRHLYVLHGMTNTDDLSERIVFPDGRELDTAAIIATLDAPKMPLRLAADVFQPEFLDRPIDDPMTDRFIEGRRPREIVEGTEAPLFHDLQSMIAMEVYLLQEVTKIVRNQSRNNVVFTPRIFEEVLRTLSAVRDLPESLRAPLVYQTLWNIAFALHHRERLAGLDGARRDLLLEHAEDKVGYGDGFEIQERNTLVLAKPGRGDDQIALGVARKVLLGNRQKHAQNHPPLVHVNAEFAGGLDNWDAFNRNVLAPLEAGVANVHAVFGDDCRVLLSFSRSHEKCFYPVRISDPTDHDDDPRESFPIDITRGLTDQNFDHHQLVLREQVYKQMMLLGPPRT